MVKNLGSKPSVSDPDAPERFVRFTDALTSAEDALREDPALAEKKGKALSAVVRAACDIQAWRALVFAQTTNGEDERAASRSIQARIDRIRESHGLAPVFRDLGSKTRKPH